MAGAGYKAFADGDVLTAAQVQTYLQDQAVMRFADSSARTSGLGTAVAEGMVSYLQDTDSVEVYDGSAWVGVGGKIVQVVTATDATERSTTSTSMTDASISISVTPTASTSTLYVIWTGTCSVYRNDAGASNRVWLSITDSSNTALEGAEAAWGFRAFRVDMADGGGGSTFVVVGKVAATDTSARTYKGRFRIDSAASSGTGYIQNADQTGRMLVLEVGA